MYIPSWLIIVGIVGAYLIIKNRSVGHVTADIIEHRVNNSFKKSIFELAHFDDPHFIDCQDAFDAMEINYLRLKQRLQHDPNKLLEIAKDWYRYAEALADIKLGRVLMDLDWDEGAIERAQDKIKEPWIIREEVEKKFKSFLGRDWQKIPPDYFKRMDTRGEIPKKVKGNLGIGNGWKYYYHDSLNYSKLAEKRKKEKRARQS